MARRLGKQVLRTKSDIKLDPMPADERKVMHQELSKLEHVKTESHGEGKNRHMVISYVDKITWYHVFFRFNIHTSMNI